jgi:site-specific recombinase XerD
MAANWTKTTPAELCDIFLQTGPANTRAAYRADLGAFMAFVKARSLTAAARMFCDMSPGEAMGSMIRYMADMRDDGYSANTVRRRIGSVLELADKAKAMDVIGWSIHVPLPKPSSSHKPSVLTVAGVMDILAYCQGRDDNKGWRDAAIVSLMYYNALRAAEVLSIDLVHYQSGHRPCVSVQAGCHRDRDNVCLSTIARDAVDRWLQCRGNAAGPMFPTLNRAKCSRGKRLTYEGLYRTVKGIATIVVGTSSVRPNGLRKAAIIEALRRTRGNVLRVMEFSRDSGPQAVMSCLAQARRLWETVGLLDNQDPVLKVQL